MCMCEVDAQEVIIWWFIYCRALLLFAVVCLSAVSREEVNYCGLYLEAGKHVCISENCCLLQWINPFLSIVKGNRDRLCHMFLCDSHFLSIGDNLCSLEEWLCFTLIYWFILWFFFSPYTFKDVCWNNHRIDLVVMINDSHWRSGESSRLTYS